MKKLMMLTLLAITFQYAFSQNVGINSTGALPAASAILDVASSDKGILIPRVALTSLASEGPIASPAVSLLVYNTATAGTSPNNVVPGYYYWSGSAWISLTTSTSNLWSKSGNAGTNASSNFLGTTDAVDLVVRTANIERARFTSAGSLGVATATPQAKLDVNGNVKLGTAGTVINGLIRTTLTVNDGTSFNYTSTRTITLTVNGATANGTIVLNPRTALPAGIGMAYARISAANTVIIGFTNSDVSARSIGNIVFDVTIIQ